MAISKEDLVTKGEILLKRLQKEHRNIRKAYRLKDQNEIDVIARLIVSYQLLTDRIATEAILYATSPPDIALSPQEKKEKKEKSGEINNMLSMTTRIRELSRTLLDDSTKGYATSADALSDEKIQYINDARKQLDELGFNLDDINVPIEVACENENNKKQVA